MRISIVGWEGSHPQHEKALEEAFEGEVLFISPKASKSDLVNAVPLSPPKNFHFDQAKFFVLDNVAPETEKLVDILVKKGAERAPGSYELPDWDIEPTDEVVESWLELGKWLEPDEPETSLEDELFGELFDEDDGFMDDDSADDLSIPDEFDEDELESSSLAGLSFSAEDNWDDIRDEDDENIDADSSSGARPSPIDSIPQDPPPQRIRPRPSRGAIDRANDMYRRGRNGRENDDGMERVGRSDDVSQSGSEDVKISFIERDGDIKGVEGGVRKTVPRGSLENTGNPREDAVEPEGNNVVENSFGDVLGDEDLLLPPSDVVDADEIMNLGYEGEVSLDDVRSDGDSIREQREFTESLSSQKSENVNLGTPELYRTDVNEKAREYEPLMLNDDESGDYKTLPEARREAGVSAPYIDALKTEGERQRQESVESSSGAMRASAYATSSDIDPNSRLVVVTGTSGGVGKTLVSYSMASMAAKGLGYLRSKGATDDTRSVYLIECDWKNPDLEELLRREYDSRGNVRMTNKSVNTIAPIVDMYAEDIMSVKKDRVHAMIPSCITKDPKTGLNIIPAPYNLVDAGHNRKALIMAIQNVVNVLLAEPGGSLIFLDCPNLEAPQNNPLMHAFLSNYKSDVVLVTKPRNFSESSRAYQYLRSSDNGLRRDGRRRSKDVASGYGVDVDRIKTVLNGVPRSEDMEVVRESFIMRTGFMPSTYIPHYTSLGRREWVGDMGTGGLEPMQREQEVAELNDLQNKIAIFLSNSYLQDLGILMRQSSAVRNAPNEKGLWQAIKRKFGWVD